MAIDLRQLRHVLTLAQTLHFGRAAEILGMTQPPLSQSIMALERELGAALFLRSKRSVALTEFGRQWLDHVRPALAAVEALPEIARQLREGRAGRLSLAFVSTADYSILPRLIHDHALAYPGVEIELIEATSDRQFQDLAEGRIHAGIAIPPDTALPPSLDYRPLLREPLIAAVPQDWLDGKQILARAGRIAGEDWMRHPLVIFPRRVAPRFHDLILGHYRGRGHQPRIRQEAIQMQTIISLVSAGIGMALVPQSLRSLARTGVRYLDIDDAPVLETGLVWRRGDDAPTLAGLRRLALGE
ncbi:LysR family transcriptional regulator [Paracoccus yeei]|uniref:LysR family transcriptional regulator n=1 Tax=Paracoccus yeei TaxID=147645 RepID=UPI000AEB422F|nr:LysR family transcriptional regulator [Paracoccus yeei]